jgi:hypothetical protein
MRLTPSQIGMLNTLRNLGNHVGDPCRRVGCHLNSMTCRTAMPAATASRFIVQRLQRGRAACVLGRCDRRQGRRPAARHRRRRVAARGRPRQVRDRRREGVDRRELQAGQIGCLRFPDRQRRRTLRPDRRLQVQRRAHRARALRLGRRAFGESAQRCAEVTLQCGRCTPRASASHLTAEVRAIAKDRRIVPAMNRLTLTQLLWERMLEEETQHFCRCVRS